MENFDKKFWTKLDELLVEHKIIIDRPKGSAHPRYPKYIYPYDYGELSGTQSQDGAGIDVWVGSIEEKVITGIFIIVDGIKKDSEIKVLVSCSNEEMEEILPYQNRGEMAAILIKRNEFS